MNINSIKQLCANNSLRWTNHILIRLLQRNITIDDVVCVLQNCEIIEEYPNDYPHPSCLVLGMSINQEYLHIVCGINDSELWLITAYRPNPGEWESDFKTRKGTNS